MTDRKAIVVRLVTEAINGRDLGVLDEICTPQLGSKLRNAFSSFADAFPDWHQELVELVAEDETVVARFRCHGTQTGPWEGLPPSGRTMKIDEVYFFDSAEHESAACGASKTPGPASANSPASKSSSANSAP